MKKETIVAITLVLAACSEQTTTTHNACVGVVTSANRWIGRIGSESIVRTTIQPELDFIVASEEQAMKCAINQRDEVGEAAYQVAKRIGELLATYRVEEQLDLSTDATLIGDDVVRVSKAVEELASAIESKAQDA